MTWRLFWFAWCAGFAGYNAALTGTRIADGSAWGWVHAACALAMVACAGLWFRWIKEAEAAKDWSAAEWAHIVMHRRRPPEWGERR